MVVMIATGSLLCVRISLVRTIAHATMVSLEMEARVHVSQFNPTAPCDQLCHC